LAASGYAETIIFRPGMLRPVGGREEKRLIENIAGVFMHHVVARLSSNAEIDTDVLGKAMVRAGELGIDQCLKNGIGAKTKLGADGHEVSLSCQKRVLEWL